MAGSISSSQKCPLCSGPLSHDEKRAGCFCELHPNISASRFIVRFPGGIFQRFRDYPTALRYLNYLRFEKDSRQTRFNADDYRAARPNSFGALAPKYLERKKEHATYRKIRHYIERAAEVLGPMNVREITGADIEDYLFSIPGISEKTRHNHMTQLRDFWTWCLKRGNIITLAEMPIFPEIKFELGYRKILNWDVQEQVLAKLKEMTHHLNPKIWLGVDMLATYTEIRPDDLRRVTEGSLDALGFLTIYNPTKKRNKHKRIKLHKDHVKEWKAIAAEFPALPDVPFFRHVGGMHSCKQGALFGPTFLYEWWCRACRELGVEGVPLYPGTKHTTATETAKVLGSDAALNASGLSNRAFERYCQVSNQGSIETVDKIRNIKKKKSDVLPFNRKSKNQ